MKKRLKTWTKGLGKLLFVLAVVGLAAVPAVFLNSIFGYFTVLFVLFLLGASLGSLLLLKRGLSFDAATEDLTCQRGSSVDVGLKLRNKSLVSCPKAQAELFISDLFGDMDALKKIPFTLAGKETVDFGFGLDMSHIGIYSVGISSVEVYDLFGVFKYHMPLSGRFTAVVTPILRPMEELVITEEVLTEASTDTRTTAVGGTDYTGVREYVPGDPMKQIHWKLSAHSRDYLTKLQESSRQQEYAVILDFATEAQEDREIMMDLHDCLIETALSLINALAERDVSYTLLYCDRGGSVVRTAQAGSENFPELIRTFSVITPEPDPSYPDGAEIMRLERKAQNRSTNVLLVTSRMTEELTQELETDQRQMRSPALYRVVPAEWTSRQLETAAAALRPLQELEIPYYFVRTSE
jgi:uncharacterized protein (DUF58 family)